MSYLIQFPSFPLPHDIRSPPYVVFGLNGKDIVADLPQHIPLKTVLHFAPKFDEWVLPSPLLVNLPKTIARLALRTPRVGIDIRSDEVELMGLKWIINRMLQASGASAPDRIFMTHPTILASISIRKTWLALELLPAGIQCVSTHIEHHINYGPAVTLAEMKALLATFTRKSSVVCAMGENFVRSHLGFEYSYDEFMKIRDWYFQNPQRRGFFRELEADYPQFAEVQRVAAKFAAAKAKKEKEKEKEKEEEGAAKSVKKVLEKGGTKKVSVEERKERHAKDEAAMRTRLKRTKSDASVRSVETVIWDPPVSKEKEETDTSAEGKDDDADMEGKKTPTVPSHKPQLPQAKGKSAQRPRLKLSIPRPGDSQFDPPLGKGSTQAEPQDPSKSSSTEIQLESPPDYRLTPSSAHVLPQSESSSSTLTADSTPPKFHAARIKLSVEEVQAMRKSVAEPEGESLAAETRRDSHDSCASSDKEADSCKKLDYMEFD